MSDSLKSMYDDVGRYVRLCERYGEKPRGDEFGIDPYCDHARNLEYRSRLKKYKIRKRDGRWEAWAEVQETSNLVRVGPRFVAPSWNAALASVLLSLQMSAKG